MSKPIIFSGEMVKAIMAGRKTQTRRAVKFPLMDRQTGCEIAGCEINSCLEQGLEICPYGVTGSRLWVKETFYDCHLDTHQKNYEYRADWSPADDAHERGFAWTPAIFMPRKASRITLEIIAVRAERLQAITDADARAEGCCGVASTRFGALNFRWLWQSINGAGSWTSNPWVWVVEFRIGKRAEVSIPGTDPSGGGA